jgi:kynurenine 3-monooxygenase
MTKKNISILGAGLSGSLLATMLGKKGFDVAVYEIRNDPRKVKIPEGKSINLALSHRGIRALKEADVFAQLEASLIPMKGRMMHDLQGELTFQPYGEDGQFINSISRNELNKALISSAESQGVDFHFNNKCLSVDTAKTTFNVEHDGVKLSVSSDIIIGADGAFSVLRKAVQHNDRFSYWQHYIEHGYKELSMPPANGDFAMEPNYLHIWPRGNFMLIALPNPDKTFTCTLFLSFDGVVESYQQLNTTNEIELFFDQHFPDITKLIPDFVSQFQNNPTSSLVTIRCEPWHYNQSLLIGDAAHAVVPFYGQGMNASFEDCRLFMELGEQLNFDWNKMLKQFSQSRKKDADAISELALRNFVEMRDHVADPLFLERKKLDAKMHDAYGDDWIPVYTMVTFTDTPYHKALTIGDKQRATLIQAQQEGYAGDLEKIMSQFQQLNS